MREDFRNRVLAAVRRIPAGQTCSYAEIAAAAGRPRAWRAVGSLLRNNYDPAIPCHRVIRADGGLGGYNRGVRLKASRLKAEGASWGRRRSRRDRGIFRENRV